MGDCGPQAPSCCVFSGRPTAHPEEQFGWLDLRVRRATGWLSRTEAEMRDEPGAPDVAQRFLAKVCRLDRERVVYDAIWSRFSGSIRLLLDNPYVHRRYWMDRNKPGGGDGWQARFDARKRHTHRALARQGAYAFCANCSSDCTCCGTSWFTAAPLGTARRITTRSRMVRPLWQPSCPTSYRS